MLGHRLLQLGQELLVVSLVVLDLAAILIEDHLRGVLGHRGLDRLELVELVHDLLEPLGILAGGRVAVEMPDRSLGLRQDVDPLFLLVLEHRDPLLPLPVSPS